MEHKKDRVIILRVIKHGEADLVINALNRQGARVGFFAKGGLKSRKRFAGGVLEATHYVEVTYKERPDGQLHTLLEAQLVQGFNNLRADYDRLKLALYFLQVMSKISQEGTVDSREMFDLLGNALKATESSGNLEALRLHFQIKVLGSQGVLPQLSNAEDWIAKPLREHAALKMATPELHQLEWEIHHSLESYLGGLQADF